VFNRVPEGEKQTHHRNFRLADRKGGINQKMQKASLLLQQYQTPLLSMTWARAYCIGMSDQMLLKK
jgi:hypothetical protein